MLILRISAAVSCAACGWAQVPNVVVQGTSPTQAVLSFTVPDPNDCQVQVSTDSNFNALVNDTNEAMFPGSQRCTRAGSIVSGSNVVFVAGLRTSQKGTDNHFHSRALECNRTHYVRIISQGVSGGAVPFTTQNPPLGAQYPEPPPFDATLTAFGNYAWPEFDWSDPSKPVIDPLTGIEIKPFTKPGTRALIEPNLSWATPFDAQGKWTNAANARTNGAGFATSAAGIGPNDDLFLPLPSFGSPTGLRVAGWEALWGLDDILVRVYGSATQADATNNLIKLCLSTDSGQTCASQTFTVALPQSPGPAMLVPASIPAPVFANWALRADQGQKVPITGTVTVAGSTVTLQNPQDGRFFDVTAAPGSKVFIAAGSGMSPTPCLNDMCTVAAVNSAVQITIAESCAASGCPAGAAYTGAGFGLRVVKTTGVGTVSVSFGYDRATSDMTDAGVNGNGRYCSNNTVTVSVDRNGVPINPSLSGYLCNTANSGLFLFIPNNADGTARGEVRLLSLEETSGFTSNGVTVNAAALLVPYNAFDANDPNTFYATSLQGNLMVLLRGKYDTSQRDGNGNACDYREWPGVPGQLYQNTLIRDCITWTNVMNPIADPPMDVVSQIVRGYQTGLNAAGQTVGPPHPGFDFSFMNVSPYVGIDGGLMTANLNNGPNAVSSGLTVFGTFDMATGLLKIVTDSFSALPHRWGSCHGCPLTTAGVWRTAVLNILVDGGTHHALNGAWQTNIAKVNRAGFGAPPNWDANTALAYNEAYSCPTNLSQDLVDLGGSGVNCVQVKVSTEACSHQPSLTFQFLDGKTEVQKFPCATVVNGTPVVPPVAIGWSKLQDIIVGDWVQDISFGCLGCTERLVVASKTVNAASDIDLWLVRWLGCRGAKFPPGLNYDDGHGNCFYPSAMYPAISTHANGWSLLMTVPFSDGNSAGSQAAIIDATNPTNPWIVDNFQKAAGHNVIGASPTPANYTFVGLTGTGLYNILYDLPVPQQAYQPLFGTVQGRPTFSGKANGTAQMENYPSNLQFTAEVGERIWSLEYRHYNPAFGAGAEYQGTGMANGQVPYTLTRMAGTSQTYQLATNANGQDSLSDGPPDPKRIPMIGVAGRYLLRDYSSPATGDVFGDANTYGWCRAYAANECRAGSTSGNLYVSVPAVDTATSSCFSNQYSRNTPCVFSHSPAGASIMQFDVSRPDVRGQRQRRLGYGLAGPMRQYEFNNARPTPDGKYFIFPGNWTDGLRRELLIGKLPPWPAEDTFDRTDFMQVPVKIDPVASEPNVRIRFGYAENGPPESLFCTTRQESCSTEIPTASPSDPYSFMGEARQVQDCSAGCTVNLPAISGRVVYYIVDRLDAVGNAVSLPMVAQVVP